MTTHSLADNRPLSPINVNEGTSIEKYHQPIVENNYVISFVDIRLILNHKKRCRTWIQKSIKLDIKLSLDDND